MRLDHLLSMENMILEIEYRYPKVSAWLAVALFNLEGAGRWKRGYSSAGRALEWHSRGQRFDPAYLHQWMGL